MMKTRTASVLLLATALMGLSACDFVRFPGDGGPPPKTPDAGPAIPPGAPGPPPPGAPVEDPYGNGEQPTDTGTDTAPGTDTDTDTGTDTLPLPDDTASTDTDAPTDTAPDDTTDVADAGDTSTDTPTDTPPDTTPGDTPPETPDVTPTPDDTDVADNTDTPPTDTPPTDTPEPPAPVEPAFAYYGPGALLPGTGEGAPDDTIFAPDMVFPIKSSPAYLESMVFTFGGGMVGGDQCDARNFEYPWRDNFCETRSANRGSVYCPVNKIHQGQDIRVGSADSCRSERSKSPVDRTAHEVVAVEDGVISNVGSYSVNLRSGGRIYKYLHMNMAKLKVKLGDSVKAGDTLGYVSNDFGGTPTVLHLHFEITQNNGNGGWDYVPPYTSLVAAYERRENGPGELIEDADVGVASTGQAFVIPPDAVIVE